MQICGTVLLEGSGVQELSAAGEESLLFFLGVCSQHLLGQSQTFVDFLLLAGRGHHTDGLSRGCRAFSHILDNLCGTNQSDASIVRNLRCSSLINATFPCFTLKLICGPHLTLAEAFCLPHGRWCCCSCTVR